MKKMLKGLMIVAMALTIAAPAMTLAATNVDLGTNYANNIGLGTSDPRDIAANIIKIVLGFLGILAVVIILIGGFKWMTAAGNEEGIEEAKKILIAGIIGLAIVLASWGIASFVLNSLISATNA
jgi:hypothetical protein